MGCEYPYAGLLPWRLFQSTHPCGVRSKGNVIKYVWRVSIHAPVWGAKVICDLSSIINGFNPRTRVGCENDLCHNYQSILVSIHAPVWGANAGGAAGTDVVEVSIHAPVWGAKYADNYVSKWGLVSIHAPVWGAKIQKAVEQAWFLFQSTHPCGVRTKGDVRLSDLIVSIHAPVWGANDDCKQSQSV